MKKIVLPILMLLLLLPGISLADCIKGNCKHGEGIYVFPDGSRYEGMFKNGRIEGEGTLEYADKSRYTGSFIGGASHGQGFIKYSDNTTYQGNFDNGSLSGKGILSEADGSRYEGDFYDGQFHGTGTFTFPDGKVYKGDFKYGLFDGQGTLTTEESVLVITYKEGICVGTGTITFLKDNTKIMGECKDGEFVYTRKVLLPKTETAAEAEPESKEAGQKPKFKIYEPENFYKQPAAIELSVPQAVGEPRQQPQNRLPVPEYTGSGTGSQGKR